MSNDTFSWFEPMSTLLRKQSVVCRVLISCECDTKKGIKQIFRRKLDAL